jgi:hypothetical protein
MARHVPLVVDSLDAANRTIAVMGKASIHRFGVKEIGKMNEAGLPVCAIDIETVLGAVRDGEKNQGVLKLEVIAQPPIEHLPQRPTLGIVIHPLRMQEPLHPLR